MRSIAVPVILIIFVALLPALTVASSLLLDAQGIGLFLGWLGAGSLVASLLLMIRNPYWVSCFGGLQQMYRWHHGMGVLSFVLLLMHPMLLAGYYVPLGSDIAEEYLSPLNPQLINILGWLALAIITLGMATTFFLHLPYGIWRRLHILLIVAIVLGFGHIWAVSGFSIGLAAALFPATIPLGWRLLRADRSGDTLPYEVSAVRHPANNITEVNLRPLAKPISIAPSQFVRAAFFEGSHFQGCGDFHPYTVSHIEKDGDLTLSIKGLGDCTRHIQSIEPGVAARLQGPYGNFLLTRPIAPEIWIAAGIGLTPFLALLRSQPAIQHTDMIYVHRENDCVPYEEELQTFATSQSLLRFHSLPMTNDLTPLFMRLESIDKLNKKHVYICGPPPFMTKVIQWLRKHGMQGEQIHFEQFDFR